MTNYKQFVNYYNLLKIYKIIINILIENNI